MKTFALPLGHLLLLFGWIANPVEAHAGKMVNGKNYEGVIATPAMMSYFTNTPPSMYNTGLWTPSEHLVHQAERGLPQALAQAAPQPKVVGTFYIPRFYTPKGTSPVATTDHERIETEAADSLTVDNFLYDVSSSLSKYKRQYLGVTIGGKKFLLMSFIYIVAISGDPDISENWRDQWVEILDGGDDFWRVLYDPATGTFSEWECNGSA